MYRNLLIILLFFFSYITFSYSENITVFQFTEEEKKLLKVRKIKKETSYTLGSNNNGNYLKAEAKGQASGLGIEKKINLNKTPIINITWKVEKDLSGIDEKSKTVKTNVKEDFKKLHNLEVNDIEGVAVMTDTDNSKKLAISYYQNIYFSSE